MTVSELPYDAGGDSELVMVCREFVELVTEHLEGSLPQEVERAIGAHLELCEPCLQYLGQVRATVGLLGALPAPSLSPVVRTRLLDVYARLHEPRSGDRHGDQERPPRRQM